MNVVTLKCSKTEERFLWSLESSDRDVAVKGEDEVTIGNVDASVLAALSPLLRQVFREDCDGHYYYSLFFQETGVEALSAFLKLLKGGICDGLSEETCDRVLDILERLKIEADLSVEQPVGGSQYFDHRLISKDSTRELQTCKESQQTFKCDQCDYKTMKAAYLKYHMIKHEDKSRRGKFVCQYCGKAFLHNRRLYNHYWYHHKNKELLKCDRCDYFTMRYDGMRTHKEKHEDKIYPCEHCGKTFRRQKTLVSHLYHSHTREEDKRFKCDVCGKAFMKQSVYRGHVDMHTGVKVFKCRVCDSRFRLNSNKLVHEKKLHPEFYAEFLKEAKRKREEKKLQAD